MTNKINKIEKNKSVVLGERYLSRDFLVAVGRMTINFSHLENILSMLCLVIIKSGYGQIITAEYSFKQLMNVIRSVLINCNEFEDFKITYNKIKQIEEKRNQIIHSFYGQNENENVIIRRKVSNKDKGLKDVREEISIETIDDIANQINDLVDNISFKMINLKVKGKI
jgi:hypothetical protein